jgi:hypothetical protein
VLSNLLTRFIDNPNSSLTTALYISVDARSDRPTTREGSMTTYVPHTIRIHIPHAHHVAVVGDFNNWHSSAHPLVQVAPDLWERIVDLPAGKHRYAFFVIDDTALTGGSVRSHIVANGAVLWVPEFLNQAVSIIAHPARAVGRREETPERLVA